MIAGGVVTSMEIIDMSESTFTPRFALGQTVVTAGVNELILAGAFDPLDLLMRHQSGDWGEVCAEDRQVNEDALKYGNRILSAYSLPDGTKLWVITEADRSVTTLLFPSEY